MDKETLRDALLRTGAAAVGFARAEPVAEEENRRLENWISSGHHAGMAWMERHAGLRRSLENVLPDVRTLISLAFPYAPAVERGPELPYLSRYAYGEDYHEAIRRRLSDVLRWMEITHVCRVCIDSAPVSERFWAIQAGIGMRGDNGAVIVPGTGPEIFLAEILTSIPFEPDAPSGAECLHCGACKRACPTGALLDDGTIDARRCISYLTIEHRGPWTETDALKAMGTPAGRNSLFGCDRCVSACPLRREPRNPVEPLPVMLALAPDNIPLDKASFKRMFAHTPLMRPGADNMLRNIRNLNKK